MLYYKPTPLYMSELVIEARKNSPAPTTISAGIEARKTLLRHAINRIKAIRRDEGGELLIAERVEEIPVYLRFFVYEYGVLVSDDSVRLEKSRYRNLKEEVKIADFVPTQGSVLDFADARSFRALLSTPCKIIEENRVVAKPWEIDRTARLLIELGASDPDDPTTVGISLRRVISNTLLLEQKQNEELENLASQ